MARLVLGEWTIDFARQEGATLTEDLQRRDYRINAMALPLNPPGELLDPTGGCRDLEAGLLTAVQEQNLIEDPLRLLRGLRLMAEIPLTLEDCTATWIHVTGRGYQTLRRSGSWRNCSAWSPVPTPMPPSTACSG